MTVVLTAHYLDPPELKSLVEESKSAWQSLGNITYGIDETEKSSVQFRRSLYIVEPMKKVKLFLDQTCEQFVLALDFLQSTLISL